MAKIKGPLFSLEAIGSIAKTKIYSGGKGKENIKRYVIPKNPKTEGQEVQRNYLKEAMLEWKTDGYTVPDIEAWNLYAKINKRTLTGMNIFLSEKITASKTGKEWTKLIDCIISDITGVGCIVVINIASDKTGKLYIGESNRAMIKEFTGVFNTDHYVFTVTGLLPDRRYYLYIKNTIGS